MKVIITTIASLILMVNVWYFSFCMRTYNRQNDKLRWVASEAAVAGALFTDKEAESLGHVQFVDAEALEAVNNVVESNLNMNSALVPQDGAYWQEPASVTVYILDDDSCRVYSNGALVNTYSFSYPYLLTVTGTSYSHTIAYPAICVSIDVGERQLGGGLIQAEAHTIRTSAYELRNQRN